MAQAEQSSAREDAFRLRGLIQAEADQANSDKLRPAEVNQAKRRCIDSFKWVSKKN
jgi:hypothetical protein